MCEFEPKLVVFVQLWLKLIYEFEPKVINFIQLWLKLVIFFTVIQYVKEQIIYHLVMYHVPFGYFHLGDSARVVTMQGSQPCMA